MYFEDCHYSQHLTNLFQLEGSPETIHVNVSCRTGIFEVGGELLVKQDWTCHTLNDQHEVYFTDAYTTFKGLFTDPEEALASYKHKCLRGFTVLQEVNNASRMHTIGLKEFFNEYLTTAAY